MANKAFSVTIVYYSGEGDEKRRDMLPFGKMEGKERSMEREGTFGCTPRPAPPPIKMPSTRDRIGFG